MTRKHFQLVADCIAAQLPEIGHTAAWKIANSLAVEFESLNPRFDRARFMAACGVEV